MRGEQVLREINDFFRKKGMPFSVSAKDMEDDPGIMGTMEAVLRGATIGGKNKDPEHIFSDAKVANGKAGGGKAGAEAEINHLQRTIIEFHMENGGARNEIRGLKRKAGHLKKELFNTERKNNDLEYHLKRSAAKKKELREIKAAVTKRMGDQITRQRQIIKQAIGFIGGAAGKKSVGKKYLQQLTAILLDGDKAPSEAIAGADESIQDTTTEDTAH